MCIWVETVVFSPVRSLVLNLHVVSSPNMSLDHRSGLLKIYGLLGPITPTSVSILTMSARYDPTR
jgi:hypothetical protein